VVEEEEVVVEEEEVVEEAGPEMVTFTVTKLDGTKVTKTVEKPRYGGTLKYSNLRSTGGFDPIDASDWQSHQMYLTNEPLLYGDWYRTTSGTGETGFLTDAAASMDMQRMMITESWEFEAPGTLTFNIRQGVYFHDKPPANGRELVAADVVYNINRYYFDESSMGWTAGQKPTSVTATDKYTVVVEVELGDAETIWALCTGGQASHIYPPEVIEEYGDMLDWRNVSGTGAFLLVDYIPDSVISLERNPNYWMDHPFYDGDRLPYVDGVKIYLIPDSSTRLAAMRTAKLDYVDEIQWEDRDALVAANPVLRSAGLAKYAVVYALFMRTDIEPFNDLKVRRALNMALDRQTMVDEFFGGHAFYWGWSTIPIADYAAIHIPFDELPADVQETYTYNPTLAKELLAEAGYPDGFSTEVHTNAGLVDVLEVVQAYFADIDVTLDLKVHESGTWTSMRRVRPADYTGMFYNWWWIGDTFTLSRVRDMSSSTNLSNVDEPTYYKAFQDIGAAWPDFDDQAKLFKAITVDIVRNAWSVNIPPYFEYNVWWPWLRDFNGEWSMGRTASPITMAPYIWYDQTMREDLGF
jgi:peptide/nickel transport system substrate-binding protein